MTPSVFCCLLSRVMRWSHENLLMVIQIEAHTGSQHCWWDVLLLWSLGVQVHVFSCLANSHFLTLPLFLLLLLPVYCSPLPSLPFPPYSRLRAHLIAPPLYASTPFRPRIPNYLSRGSRYQNSLAQSPVVNKSLIFNWSDIDSTGA